MTSQFNNVAVFGAHGALGSAFIRLLVESGATVHGFSRKAGVVAGTAIEGVDYLDVGSMQEAASQFSNHPLDLLLVTTGILHGDDLMPEKSLKEIAPTHMARVIEVNTVVPTMIISTFLPYMAKKHSVMAVLSARVGSISDNRLGGWYSYRASKAALNMVIKTAAIEARRLNNQLVLAGLHPGTVDSALSKPFQKRVPEGSLFTADFAAQQLMQVINNLTEQDSGKCFAWDGTQIPP